MKKWLLFPLLAVMLFLAACEYSHDSMPKQTKERKGDAADTLAKLKAGTKFTFVPDTSRYGKYKLIMEGKKVAEVDTYKEEQEHGPLLALLSKKGGFLTAVNSDMKAIAGDRTVGAVWMDFEERDGFISWDEDERVARWAPSLTALPVAATDQVGDDYYRLELFDREGQVTWRAEEIWEDDEFTVRLSQVRESSDTPPLRAILLTLVDMEGNMDNYYRSDE